MTSGYLILETGETFSGNLIGADIEVEGEVVFNTSMTGYQEMITDPSYKGQILTFCYPIIGNYGINEQDNESEELAVSGVIMNDLCEEPSHYQSTASLSQKLKHANIPGLVNIDTRALVAVIRKHGTVSGKIVKTKKAQRSSWHKPNAIQLVHSVSVKKDESYGYGEPHIVMVDFGYKKSILQALLDQGCRVSIVPWNTTMDYIRALNPDGVLISNGPGDPMELTEVFPTIKAITEQYPTLGICLGHQLIVLSYGGRTTKMPFGHRGGNHPVKDLITGKVQMTSQNHGYVVVEDSVDSEQFQIVFKNVNDQSVEGVKHVRLPVQSVQFHPEAHPGPSDSAYIFTDFIGQVLAARGRKYVTA
ncbi:carbamoyl phosphate synthase small subunit [Oceanobacillus piezotolerans]|uniref:Carbamoyl phosphate synthase small chain n=1 Tax=Oceanobacillus piezotolerans TaxID=2448030 RepID=A0A498DMG6_9BACI|nr:carbamoyl phosphate synthase small subunit [Oceanobacillus piezotolerans]RLL44952.1 carbamoyl phosphate synthase small subunit [Oceanobacillus piezotolerans]